MIGAGEHDDLVAAGHGAGEPERDHDRLRAGVAIRHALHAGHAGDPLGDVATHVGLKAHRHARVDPAVHRLDDEIRVVTEQVDAEPEAEVDVLVAVDVPTTGSGAALADDRIAHAPGGDPEL